MLMDLTAAGLDADMEDSRNYIVRNYPNKYPDHWWFQIYQKKLDRKAQNGNFMVVFVCECGSQSQKRFAVPYHYLRENVLPKAHLELNGQRYFFSIRKKKPSVCLNRRRSLRWYELLGFLISPRVLSESRLWTSIFVS